MVVCSTRYVSLLTRYSLALILAGGRGPQLQQLTHWRAKPSVPFGGKFRIIDFPLSNCINSGIRRIGVLTQYKSHSLIQHIQKGWSFLRGEFDEFVELLPAQQRLETSWYTGTADAVYQNIDIIHSHEPDYVLILAGDHIYKMDYGPMLAQHVESQADITIGCIEVPVEQASAFGVMSVDEEGRILQFEEKPARPQPLPGNPAMALVSMGIYVFSARFLLDQLVEDAHNPVSTHDFGRDIIPAAITRYKVVNYPFRKAQSNTQAFWRDVGTIDAYWEANMELVGVTPEINLYDETWPIWTYQEQLPPAKFVFDDGARQGVAVDSMVSGGCIISGAYVRRSLLCSNVQVNSYTQVEDSIIMPDVEIGSGCRIKNAIVDQGCRVPDETVIGVGAREEPGRYYVSPKGITLVVPEMLGQDIRIIR